MRAMPDCHASGLSTVQRVQHLIPACRATPGIHQGRMPWCSSGGVMMGLDNILSREVTELRPWASCGKGVTPAVNPARGHAVVGGQPQLVNGNP